MLFTDDRRRQRGWKNYLPVWLVEKFKRSDLWLDLCIIEFEEMINTPVLWLPASTQDSCLEIAATIGISLIYDDSPSLRRALAKPITRWGVGWDGDRWTRSGSLIARSGPLVTLAYQAYDGRMETRIPPMPNPDIEDPTQSLKIPSSISGTRRYLPQSQLALF